MLKRQEATGRAVHYQCLWNQQDLHIQAFHVTMHVICGDWGQASFQ